MLALALRIYFSKCDEEGGDGAIFLAAQCLDEIREVGVIREVRELARQKLLSLLDVEETEDAMPNDCASDLLSRPTHLRILAVAKIASAWRSDTATLPLLKRIAISDRHPIVRKVAIEKVAEWKDCGVTLAWLKDCAINDTNEFPRQAAVCAVAEGWARNPLVLEWVLERIKNDPDGTRTANLATELMSTRQTLPYAETILRNCISKSSGPRKANVVTDWMTNQLVLCVIAQGHFSEARLIISKERNLLESAPNKIFNYAMAEWGDTKRVPADLFARVIEIHTSQRGGRKGANYLQCLALSAWGAGDTTLAEELLTEAETSINETEKEFSAWRYLQVGEPEFSEDLRAIRRLMRNADVRPLVFGATD